MSKEQRALIDSLTPENRNILLLLQMRMGCYMDGEIEFCRRVNVIRNNGVEYLCPARNPSIYKGIATQPLVLNAFGEIILANETVTIGGAPVYVGSLDIMVGAAELQEGMRRNSVERRKVASTPLMGGRRITDGPGVNPLSQLGEGIELPVGGRDARKFRNVTVGEMDPLPDRSDVVISLDRHRPLRQSPIRIHGESEINTERLGLNLNPEVLASINSFIGEESRSASASLAKNMMPLSDSEYFNRKMQLPGYTPPKFSFWTRMGWKWESFKERVAESRVGQFFRNLFNR
jgi:hypothetical protein